MRLLFDRDLTPHPQYAAFYKWLQQEYKADAVVHFGMHGTVEWLPGAPLGKHSLQGLCFVGEQSFSYSPAGYANATLDEHGLVLFYHF